MMARSNRVSVDESDAGEEVGPDTASRSHGWTAAAWLGGVILVPMTIYIVANALSRKLLAAPFPFSVEVVQYWFMPALVCLGFIIAELRGQHVAADLLFNRFPSTGRKWLTACTSLLGAVTMAALTWFTLSEAVRANRMELVAGSTPLPIWQFYFLPPIAFAITTALLAIATIRAVRAPRSHFENDRDSHIAGSGGSDEKASMP